MDFKYKTVAQINEMTSDEQERYISEKKTHEDKVRKTELDEAVKEALKPLGIGQSEMKESVNSLTEEVNALKEGMKSTKTVQSLDELREKVESYITDNHKDIINTVKSNGLIDISKAVGIVTTANGTLPVALPANYAAERMGVPNVRLSRPYLFEYVNSYSTNEKSLTYIEAVPGEGDFAVVAEGAAKPQLDFDWVTRYVVPTKFAGWIKLTDEVLYDIPRLTDLVMNYLKDKHDIFKDNQIFSYINTNSTAFATGTSISGTVTAPNIIDVVNALQLQILNSPNYVDEPDFYADTVLLNPTDFFTYFATVKDAMGRNLYSDQMMLGGSMIYNGLRFVSTKQVTAGNIIVFDSSKIDVTNYLPYHIKMGWVDDDFIKNQRVILAESRGHILIKNHDKRAFVKGSIAAIVADIKVPA